MSAPKVHAFGAIGYANFRTTACNSFMGEGPRAVLATEDLSAVDCSKCIKALGIGETDEKLALMDHRYRDPRTGHVLPFSVTAIARSFDTGDPFGAGAQWGARLQREGKSPIDERDKAADLGRRVHAHGSAWAAGKAVDALPDEEPYLDALEAFVRSKRPVWMESEQAVVSRNVGGRFDLIGEFDDGYFLVDLKTGRTEHPDTDRLQLAGYIDMDGIVEFDKAGTATGVRRMPFITGAGCLYLGADGKATWRDYLTTPAEIAQSVEHFRSILKIRLDLRAASAQRKANR